MARVYGYLAKDVRLNNPSYLVWKNRPVGENIFPALTKVLLLKPTKHDEKRLKAIAKQNQEPCFVVKIEGHRVYLTRNSLLTEEEYNERRDQADQRNSKTKSKLALLKNAQRDMGKGKS